MGNTVEIWPFLYTRTRDADYDFVMLPEPLAHDRGAALALERALERPQGEAESELRLPQGLVHVYVRNEAARLDGLPVKDAVGREIHSLSGFLASAPLAGAEVERTFARVGQALQGLTQLIWGERRRVPLLSLATAARPAAPASPAPTRLPQSPGPSAAAAARERPQRLSWRARFEVALVLAVLGLLLAVLQLASSLSAVRASDARPAAARPASGSGASANAASAAPAGSQPSAPSPRPTGR